MVTVPQSGIRDNHTRGTLADFLRSKIRHGSHLSVMSAYFTIYAFDALRDHLNSIDHLDFLFGEPRFVKSLDPDRTDKKAFQIEDEGLHLANRLEQKRAARECSEWVRQKVAIKSVKETNLLHGKMYHIAKDGIEDAILGSSNFTVRGLGLATSGNNIELNLEVDSTRDRRDLKAWFDELWNNDQLVEDVRQDVLLYLEQLYQNHSPEFIYFKTLFHIFEKFLGEQERGGLLDQAINLVDTDIWKTLFEFQKDGVKGPSIRSSSTTAVPWPIASDWGRPTKPLPSSSISNCGMSGSWCSARRNCGTTGRCTRPTTIVSSTRS